MANYKEIVTKAVIGKGKKKFLTNHELTPTCEASTILGCWVINHVITIGDKKIKLFCIKLTFFIRNAKIPIMI